MGRFKEIGRRDCRFYLGTHCTALTTMDCRQGRKCSFYQPVTKVKVVKPLTVDTPDIKYYAEPAELKTLMNSKHVRVIDMATALHIRQDAMSKKLNAHRTLHEIEAETICKILDIADTEFCKYFRIARIKK